MKKKFETYNEAEFETLKEGGAILRQILQDGRALFVMGKTTLEIDAEIEEMIRDRGGEPAFKNYKPKGFSTAYKYSSCISINEEVTHGMPSDRVVVDGDLVSLDVGIKYKSLFLDAAISFGIGKISDKETKLLEIGENALRVAIERIKPNCHVNDIGVATEKYAKSMGAKVVYELCGHGVGRNVHEEPLIPHVDLGRKGEMLVEGMVLAIEPHVTFGNGKIFAKKGNEYTLYSGDGAKAVQFEHTVYISKNGPIILT